MTISDIWALIHRHTHPLDGEVVPLISTFGRVSVRSLSTDKEMPPFDLSALDGYALNGEGPSFVIEEVLEPFSPVSGRPEEGGAFFVPTGGRLPPATRFVAREHVREEGRTIVVKTKMDETRVVKKGDWLKRGTRLLDRGESITPSAMALLALAGIKTVTVHRRPTVAVITTGGELKQGRLIDSNRFLLTGLIHRDGGDLRGCYTADDTEEDILHILSAMGPVDLVILTGGTSKGKMDVTKPAIRRWGRDLLPGVSPCASRKDNGLREEGRYGLLHPSGQSGSCAQRVRALREEKSPPTGRAGKPSGGMHPSFDRGDREASGFHHRNTRSDQDRDIDHTGNASTRTERFCRARGGHAVSPARTKGEGDTDMSIPVLCLVGRSNTGKTTLIEKLIPLFGAEGIRVATIKHHNHDFEIDREGKDTYRHKKAGARLSMIVSPKKLAFVEDLKDELPLDEILSRYVRDVDLVIVEGYKEESVPKIEVYTYAEDRPPVALGDKDLLAVVSDRLFGFPLPVFLRDDIAGIAEFVKGEIERIRR
jgi:molybdopterin-guanine dinucleotide biosynthesis adapter protein